MGENSKIEWTDHTFNPWVGCTKVGPGCDRCYAESWAKRWDRVTWGPHGERRRTSIANWKKPYQWNKQALLGGRRDRVFCASLADWLDNQVPKEWRWDLCQLIRETPNLDWLLLTKRIQNFAKLALWDTVPSNVWLGITCVNQEEYDRDWPVLAGISTHGVRFVSYEPAIGPLLPKAVLAHGVSDWPDWLICGGETGHGARHMDPVWARACMQECHRMGTAFFMKQMTERKPIPASLMVREFPDVRPF